MELADAPAEVPEPSRKPKQVMMCVACTGVLNDENLGYRCSECAFGYCKPCLRSWFVLASKTLNQMPVQCCYEDIALVPGTLKVLVDGEVSPPWPSHIPSGVGPHTLAYGDRRATA